MSDAVGCKTGRCCLANVMAKAGKGGSIRMLFVKLTSCRIGAGGPKERQSLGKKVKGAVEIHLSLRSITEAARRSCIVLNLQESLEPGFKSRLRHMTQPCSNSSFNSYTHNYHSTHLFSYPITIHHAITISPNLIFGTAEHQLSSYDDRSSARLHGRSRNQRLRRILRSERCFHHNLPLPRKCNVYLRYTSRRDDISSHGPLCLPTKHTVAPCGNLRETFHVGMGDRLEPLSRIRHQVEWRSHYECCLSMDEGNLFFQQQWSAHSDYQSWKPCQQAEFCEYS